MDSVRKYLFSFVNICSRLNLFISLTINCLFKKLVWRIYEHALSVIPLFEEGWTKNFVQITVGMPTITNSIRTVKTWYATSTTGCERTTGFLIVFSSGMGKQELPKPVYSIRDSILNLSPISTPQKRVLPIILFMIWVIYPWTTIII